MIVAGLISGTSLDGIDVALVDIRGAGFRMRVRPLAHHTFPYPAGIRKALLAVSNAVAHTGQVSALNFLLGELFADAAARACRLAKIPMQELRLIGSHGQTIYHQGKPRRLF